jgi:signal peptidase I
MAQGMSLRWFFSKKVRQATDLCHRVRKLLNSQRDLLSGQAIEAVAKAIDEVRDAINSGQDQAAISAREANLENAANKWLKPYPHAAVRENLDVILVALAVALAIRTFFLQPMAIPTGSMQPTLYGITHQDLRKNPDEKIPNAITKVFLSLLKGTSYYQVTAQADGEFRGFEPPKTIFPFVKKQRLVIANQKPFTVWFPPDKFEERSGLQIGDVFRKGDDIVKLKVVSGDRLFADRFTYNFRRPERGEIIIFATDGIPALQQGTHYIKRLTGLGGDKVQIGNDRHLIINGARLDASTPHFENIYSFTDPPRESRYSGHVNNWVAKEFGRLLASDGQFLFPDETAAYSIRPKHYVAMGDNTMNSYDSRYWGDFPQEKVIGKCAFVFWPISSRFGWAVR